MAHKGNLSPTIASEIFLVGVAFLAFNLWRAGRDDSAIICTGKEQCGVDLMDNVLVNFKHRITISRPCDTSTELHVTRLDASFATPRSGSVSC